VSSQEYARSIERARDRNLIASIVELRQADGRQGGGREERRLLGERELGRPRRLLVGRFLIVFAQAKVRTRTG
jgi:hypothetical protein